MAGRMARWALVAWTWNVMWFTPLPAAEPSVRVDGPMYLWVSAHSGVPQASGAPPKMEETRGRIEVWRGGILQEVLLGEGAFTEFMTREQRRVEAELQKKRAEARRGRARLQMQRLKKYERSIYNNPNTPLPRLAKEAKIRTTKRRGEEKPGEAFSLRDEINEILYAAHAAAANDNPERACALLAIGFGQTDKRQAKEISGDEMERIVLAQDTYGCP